MHLFFLGVLLLFVAGACVLSAAPRVTIREGAIRDEPVRGRREAREGRVLPPRVWMEAADALSAAHHQAGLLYCILPADFSGAVGPFRPGEAVEVEDLVLRVAEATGTHLRWINDVAVFDPRAEGAEAVDGEAPAEVEASSPRAEVSALDGKGDSSVVVRLTELAGHEDGSVRLHALAALQRLEGDFVRNAWPGRVSIFEVLADRIDHKALLFALEEGGPLGGRSWKLAAEILGRARERVLARYLSGTSLRPLARTASALGEMEV